MSASGNPQSRLIGGKNHYKKALSCTPFWSARDEMQCTVYDQGRQVIAAAQACQGATGKVVG